MLDLEPRLRERLLSEALTADTARVDELLKVFFDSLSPKKTT